MRRGPSAPFDFCAERGIPYSKCGKLVVACDESELPAIEALSRRGKDNGVEGLKVISQAEARALEPELRAVGALFSPETGILDSHALMLALRGDAADSSAVFVFRTPFLRARLEGHAVRISAGGREPTAATARVMVNCAGLNASAVARAVEGRRRERSGHGYAKGNYFALGGRAPFERLIYPAPQVHGLGVHLTFDLAGQARFGPDVEWVDAIDYGVNPARSEGFVAAIRRYWPGLPNRALTPAYSGIRPKLGGPNDPAADFRIEAQTFGDAMLVNLFGIESPGLTSSLAIAGHVLSLVDESGDPRSRRRSSPSSRAAEPYDRKSSVTNRSGAKAYLFRSLRINFSAASLSLRDENVKDLAFGVDCAPEIDHPAAEFQIDLVQMPSRSHAIFSEYKNLKKWMNTEPVSVRIDRLIGAGQSLATAPSRRGLVLRRHSQSKLVSLMEHLVSCGRLRPRSPSWLMSGGRPSGRCSRRLGESGRQ